MSVPIMPCLALLAFACGIAAVLWEMHLQDREREAMATVVKALLTNPPAIVDRSSTAVE